MHFPNVSHLLDHIVTVSKNIISLPLILSCYRNIWICMSHNKGRQTDNHNPCIKVTKVRLLDFFKRLISTLLNRNAKWFIVIFYKTLARPKLPPITKILRLGRLTFKGSTFETFGFSNVADDEEFPPSSSFIKFAGIFLYWP